MASPSRVPSTVTLFPHINNYTFGSASRKRNLDEDVSDTERYTSRRRLSVEQRSAVKSFLGCQPILEEDQAGSCIVVYKKNASAALVALKALERRGRTGRIVKTYHTTLINIEDFIDNDGFPTVAYEHASMSLTELRSCPSSLFREAELATVCKEVRLPQKPKKPLASLIVEVDIERH